MSRERLRRIFGVAALVCLASFPLFALVGDALGPDRFQALGLLDAGGQSDYSRALLRSSIAASLLFLWLWAPPVLRWERTEQSAFWGWCGGGLAAGLLSCLVSLHPYQALLEWETWYLVALLGYTVSFWSRTQLERVATPVLYGGGAVVLVHALFLAVTGQDGRLGGLYHHPNAFSTLLLGSLPLFWWRVSAKGDDRAVACVFTGATVATLIGTQSLTGLLLLALVGGLWAIERRVVGFVVGGLGAGFLLLMNFLYPSAVLPSLAGLGLAFLFVKARGAPALGGVLGLCALSCLTSILMLWSVQPELTKGPVSRQLSGAVRIDLLWGGAQLLQERPLWGVGPAGFGRHYPSVQESVVSYSRFIHGTVWELAVEWGVIALVCWTSALFCFFWGLRHSVQGSFRQACGAAALLGWMHSLTDTQTQFPQLMVMGWVLLGASLSQEGVPALRSSVAEGAFAAEAEESRSRFALRLALLGILLGLLWVNSVRASSALLQEIGLRNPHLSDERRLALFEESARLLPGDAEAWRGLALMRLKLGNGEGAFEAATAAVARDPHRAACWYALLRALPPRERAPTLARAVQVDPNNYPWFHAAEAAELVRQGQYDEARERLEAAKVRYGPDRLALLPSFRRSDLEEQLVALLAVEALLEEASGRGTAANQALSRAVFLAAGRPGRWETLRSAPDRFALPSSESYHRMLRDFEASFSGGPSSTGPPEPVRSELDQTGGL